jgi:L-malate glycosyltransferase
VLRCSALTGAGIDELWDAIGAAHDRLRVDGPDGLDALRGRQAVAWMWSEVTDTLIDRLRRAPSVRAALHAAEKDVTAGRRSPTAAAAELLDAFLGQPLDAVAEGRADAAADPALAARITDALAPFDRSPTDVGGLLREVERRSAIDVDAPLEGAGPAVLRAKAAVRKATSFTTRHLAQQVGVLTAALARVGRDLDGRVRALEQRASLELALGDLPAPAAAWAAVLDPLAASAPGPRRDLRHPGEAASAAGGHRRPGGDRRRGRRADHRRRLAVAARAVAGLAPGGTVAVATTDGTAWDEVADGVLADLVPGRPLRPPPGSVCSSTSAPGSWRSTGAHLAPGHRAGSGDAVRDVTTVHQVLHAVAPGDAVSTHAVLLRAALRRPGSPATSTPPASRTAAPPEPGLADLPAPDGASALLYHASIGSEAAAVVPGRGPEPLVINHHNITPVEHLVGWAPTWPTGPRGAGPSWRRWPPGHPRHRRLAAQRRRADPGRVPPQHHGAGALRRHRPRRPRGRPPSRPPPRRPLAVRRPGRAQQGRPRPGGGAGLVPPAPRPRGHPHAGGKRSVPAYAEQVEALAATLGIAGAVRMAGSLDGDGLIAAYRSADVFVSCSDHEGFGIPLVEAMGHGLPVVAYGAAAVPSTVGDAGIVLPEKSPAVVAAAVHRVITDDAARAALVAAGRDRLEQLRPARSAERFVEVLRNGLAGGERPYHPGSP